MKKQKGKIFTPDELSVFCSQVAMLLAGGVPLYEGTGILYEEMEDKDTKKVLESIDASLKEGVTFAECLEKTGAFPQYLIHMVHIGETTGKLEDIMKSLAAYYERENRVAVSIRNVITYPMLLFGLMAVILIVLVTKILPMFQNVFAELENRTPGAKSMMDASLTGSKVLTVIVTVVAVILSVSLLVFRLRKGAGALGDLIEFLPFTGKLSEKLGLGAFMAAMSVMVSAGMETEEAVEQAAMVVTDKKTSEKIACAKKELDDMVSLDTVFMKTGILSGMEGRMLTVGLKAGAVDKVLYELSSHLDEDIDDRMNNLSAHIETVLVIALSVMVGIILLSVMMPLISVISSI